MPWMGIVDAYGGKNAEYYSAFGLYLFGKQQYMLALP
jgi:hypothetical protein